MHSALYFMLYVVRLDHLKQCNPIAAAQYWRVQKVAILPPKVGLVFS